MSNMIVLGGQYNPIIDIGNYVSIDSITEIGISTVKHKKFIQFESESQKPAHVNRDYKLT
jgi:hypothetical protein